MGNPITRVSTPTVKYAVPGDVKSVDGKTSGSNGIRQKGKLPGLKQVSSKDSVYTKEQTLTKIRAGLKKVPKNVGGNSGEGMKALLTKTEKKSVGKTTVRSNSPKLPTQPKKVAGDAIGAEFRKYPAFAKSLSAENLKGLREDLNKDKKSRAELLSAVSKGLVEKIPSGKLSVSGKDEYFKGVLVGVFQGEVENALKTEHRSGKRRDDETFRKDVLARLKGTDKVAAMARSSTVKKALGLPDNFRFLKKTGGKGAETKVRVEQNGKTPGSYLVKYDVQMPVDGFGFQGKNRTLAFGQEVKGGKVSGKFALKVDFARDKDGPFCTLELQSLDHVTLDCGKHVRIIGSEK